MRETRLGLITSFFLLTVATAGSASCGSGSGDAASPGSGDTWQKVKERGEIVWAADLQGGEPYVFEDPKDPSRLTGFEVEIMDAVAKRLGVRQRMVQYNWSNLVPSLERGDFDLTMNGIEATAERADHGLLSRPYYVYGETLAVRKGSPLRTIKDLEGHSVGTLNQSVAYDILRTSHVDVRIYEGVEEPYIDLVQNRVDGVLLDDVVADRWGCQMPGVECIPGDIARGTYVVVMRKGDDELKTKVDGALDALIADGEMQTILTRWHLWNSRQTDPPPAILEPVDHARSFDWNQFVLFLEGAAVTLQVSLLAFLIAVPVGLMLALARIYGARPLAIVARVYIEIFRGTPVLLQLYLLYYGLADLLSLSPLAAAVIGLGLNYAAYEAEVYRGALLAIPRGQTEAAKALGFGSWQILRHVLIPQAFTIALPPMTNDFVSLLKDSSLISVITVIELTKRMTIAGVDLHGWLVPGLACAALYLALSFPLAELARRLERRLARDHRPRTL